MPRIRSIPTLLALTCCAVLSLAASARAEVTAFHIADRTPYADGREFADIGAYERLTGRVHFVVDPKAAANRAVVDLLLAPRNEDGLVEFSADLDILLPADPAKSRGAIFYDVNNRGRRMALRMFNDGADEFLMRQGYVVLWCGWIAEVLPVEDAESPGERLMRMDVPLALENGEPVRGSYRAEMMTDEPAARMSVSNRPVIGSYPPTEQGKREATLSWRLNERDERVAIPREQWKWIITPTDKTHPDALPLPLVEIELAGGFQPGYIYELIYEAEGSVVQGLGMAAIRDLISFLKYDQSEQNPLYVNDRLTARRAIGFGISQSGRLLRMLLYQGFNADERGRIVFDGLIPHVSGGGLGFFNHRFAAPTRYASQHTNHLFPCDMFPFAYETQKDHLTGQEDGLLEQARQANAVPKIMHIQNSAEYWHRSGSLVHTDTKSNRDAAVPPEVRIYAVGGAQHGWGDDVLKPGGDGMLPENPTDYRPFLRGLLTALDEWIAEETTPPASRYPRIDEGTLVHWAAEKTGWQALPGVRYPEMIQQAELLDYGPMFRSHGRITLHPPRRLEAYPVLVPAVGEDNNELGMLLSPTVAVPVATYTGWNLRHRSIGAQSELLRLKGGFVPFSRTKAERTASGDPRPAILERYESFDDYVQQFELYAEQLIRERYLLAEDKPRLLERAERYRALFEK